MFIYIYMMFIALPVGIGTNQFDDKYALNEILIVLAEINPEAMGKDFYLLGLD